MKASDFIAEFLMKKGIKSVFELSGGMITHILDSLNQKTDINIITMHHEQGAAFAAEGYARITGLPGIALATSGPGATNLLTGIGSCYFDSTPAIFITGQVNRHELKGDREIRQLGFQETDIVTMARPITKACFHINDPNDLPNVFEKAFKISLEGRPGPVLIDIPMDVQRIQIENNSFIDDSVKPLEINADILEKLIEDIKKAKRPLILSGRGIKASTSQDLFEDFVRKTKIPVITTLLGLDTITYDNAQRVGFIGSYGNRWANIAFGECDLLIVLGSRLDIRQTGADTKFIENRKIYHIDCERGEVNNRVKGCEAIITDLSIFFQEFDKAVSNISFVLKEEWNNQINNLKITWPDSKELDAKGINPNVFMHLLSNKSRKAKAYLADVGSHQMWAAQSLELYHDQQFLTSGGMGAMGFSLPAGIGASIALNKEPVVVLVGDGCMQINIQELQTIVRNKLPVKIIVLNNRTLGMIRQFQDSYFESRYQSTYWGYDAPDFAKVAIAYGIESKTIEKPEEIEDAIDWFWNVENEDKPQLLQVMIDPHTNTYPKIAFGRPITEMEPFAKPIAMEAT
ncbi:acetolactate synthase-1/2/3 large subunit [Flavobacterium araucananum]|uniref:Acetolactate synthase n=1 Tax=Flavobacterium araucananum TaxID=946678 RepID=A0A227PI72_9FLAO|nr:thiamine pyrophosphate-binding protein [Flavobacterium araucananum]OXG08755.1 acetolactate synthase [Flavobacterium araucananum]PWJ97755.1 acetolactate synthase-1/2/3 large subunit [Flavobacterium araucananum]